MKSQDIGRHSTRYCGGDLKNSIFRTSLREDISMSEENDIDEEYRALEQPHVHSVDAHTLAHKDDAIQEPSSSISARLRPLPVRFPTPLSDIDIILSGRGESCDSVCQAGGTTCVDPLLAAIS